MSPDRARVFLVEDNQLQLSSFRFLIERGEHQIVAEAHSLQEALDLVPRLRDLKVDVAVLDGNLSKGKSDGKDGQQVAEEIRQVAPELRIICFSEQKYDWGDAVVSKGEAVKSPDFGPGNILPRTITEL